MGYSTQMFSELRLNNSNFPQQALTVTLVICKTHSNLIFNIIKSEYYCAGIAWLTVAPAVAQKS